MTTCRIVDVGTDVRCLTHDVQAELLWPDLASSRETLADYMCPVVDELPVAYGRRLVPSAEVVSS